MSIEVKYVESEEWLKMPFDTQFKPKGWFSAFWLEWMVSIK